MFKQYFKQIMCILILIFVLVFGMKQYYDKKMYEEYISHVITNNTQDLIIGIMETHDIYDQIINNKELTSQQLNLLITYNYNILQSFQYNLGLSQQFGLTEEEKEKIKNDLHEIGKFLIQLNNNLEVKKLDKEVLELDLILKDQLTHINELNKRWLNSLYTNIEELDKNGDEYVFNSLQFQKQHGDSMISNHIWINLLNDLSAIHKGYLIENDLYSISEVLK